VDAAFGNDPQNWTAANPTPGMSLLSPDTDGDGLPDDWEITFGFDRLNPIDAALDADGDGLTNLQEYQMGTNPRDRQSGLRLSIAMLPDATNLVLSFAATANFSYTIEYSDAVTPPAWLPFRDIPPAPTNQLIAIIVPATDPARFYRLRTPSLGAAAAPLRINSIQPSPGGQDLLNFTAAAGQSFSIEFNPTLVPGAWTTLTNYPPAPTNRTLQLLVPSPEPTGFYRLRGTNP
jgi:hypothetical protein